MARRSLDEAGWFHYDQVGSVMAETNASGNMTAQHHPDAFGNQMASWQTGLWTNTYNDRKGWHHNTKEFDADTGLVYMYQRWYFPETGTFVSKAPFPPEMEHPYVALLSNSSIFIDEEGRFIPASSDKY